MRYRLANNQIYDNYTENLLKERGIEDFDAFIHPTVNLIQDPRAFDNIAEGKELLFRVIHNGGHIHIVCDSDTDGFTSTTIMYNYIKRISPDTEITCSIHTGKQHGLSDVIDEIINSETKYDLVITPDASSNDFVYHEQLAELGIPVLVLDHHLIDNEISSNAIIINNQSSPNYENKELTGAGVVYQFCRYIDMVEGTDYADDYMDLAALGIVGDMGSMAEPENQYIIQTGFTEDHIKNFFLKVLIDKQSYSMQNKVNPTTVAFYIVPLINAMIRVGTMDEKHRLLMAFLDGHTEVVSHKRGAKGAMELVAVESARECGNARNHQNQIKDTAVANLTEKILKHGLLDNRILFVRLDEDDDFPPELNGLVAMKLSAEFKRPTIVARLNDEGYDRGSIRGLNDSEFNMFKTFLTDSGYFEYVLGHENAAGASILDKNLSDFHKYANEALKDVDFGENVYDVNFDRFAIDDDLANIIFDVGVYEHIWGQKNPVPLIHVGGINVRKSDIQIIGSRKDTVKFEKNGVTYIQFKANDFIHQLDSMPNNIQIEVVGKASLNEWAGRTTPQIMITDYEMRDSELSF